MEPHKSKTLITLTFTEHEVRCVCAVMDTVESMIGCGDDDGEFETGVRAFRSVLKRKEQEYENTSSNP